MDHSTIYMLLGGLALALIGLILVKVSARLQKKLTETDQPEATNEIIKPEKHEEER